MSGTAKKKKKRTQVHGMSSHFCMLVRRAASTGGKLVRSLRVLTILPRASLQTLSAVPLFCGSSGTAHVPRRGAFGLCTALGIVSPPKFTIKGGADLSVDQFASQLRATTDPFVAMTIRANIVTPRHPDNMTYSSVLSDATIGGWKTFTMLSRWLRALSSPDRRWHVVDDLRCHRCHHFPIT